MRIKGLDFEGQRINFVQIGLGTNSTFIQNCAGADGEWDRGIDWLLDVTSERRPHAVKGVAVEPVAEHVEALREPVGWLPGVELVQAAVGERDTWGAEIRVFGPGARDALLQRVAPAKRESLERDLEYILNMSCVGATHPLLPQLCWNISEEYGLRVDVESRQADVWTWSSLSRSCHFRGCEVLLVDTEGYDAQILRSLIKHCRWDPESWPWLIQFETMGHCDKLEGQGTEWAIIGALEAEGYRLVNYSYHNTHLVLETALRSEPRLEAWVGSWKCRDCHRSWALPYISTGEGIYCKRCRCTSTWRYGGNDWDQRWQTSYRGYAGWRRWSDHHGGS